MSDFYRPFLVVHPSRKVLPVNMSSLLRFGAQSYPFNRDHIDYLFQKDELIRNKIRSIDDSRISLGELLQCNNLELIADPTRCILTSDLDREDSVVGIYLCSYGFKGGSFMSCLQKIHQECRDKGRKFEIVLLPVPCGEYSNPHTHYNEIKKSALQNSTSASWWTIPFSDTVCRSLWRLFYQELKDQLIILPRSGHPGELYGRHVAAFYGADAYPFTRDVIIKWQIDELQSVTLKHLVGVVYYHSHLQNKNVLLYLDFPKFDFDHGGLYDIMCEATPKIKVIYPESHMVFFPLEPISRVQKSRINKAWPVLPQRLCKSVIKYIFQEDEVNPGGLVYPALVAFGKDGKILSRRAEHRLPVRTRFQSKSLFDNTLFSEISEDIQRTIDESSY